MRYFEECRYIWKNLVPKNGQADNLQGELLRQIEKLRYEAQNNGNINWDNNFEYFCDFLENALCKDDVLPADEKSDVSGALYKIKSAGQLADKYNNGEVSDEQLEAQGICELAYIEDDLYDVVCDAIGAFYTKHPALIPHEPNPDIYR